MLWMSLNEWQQLPEMPGIYMIRHRETRKAYIGQSKNVRQRVASHRYARSWHYFGRALRRHGLGAFEVCLLVAGAPENLGLLEQIMILEHGTKVPNGYNLSAGGLGPTGVTWSYERRQAQSLARTGFQHRPDSIEKMREAARKNNGFRGKKHTTETKAKIGAATMRIHTGMKRSAEARANISASLKGRAPTVLSPEVRARIAEAHRKPNPKKSQPGAANGNAKRVGLWVVDALLPRVFSTGTEAAAWAGVSLNLMSQWCYGKSSNLGNWAYV